jgi:replication factor C subunit 3/5
MTLELNASDERGIDVVRSQISDFASTKRIFSTGFKLIVLDECDAMTKDAQFALRRVIEKYTRNTRFCLICNYVSKVIPALQSRCTRFRFAPLPRDCVLERLRVVSDAEGYVFSRHTHRVPLYPLPRLTPPSPSLDVSVDALEAVAALSGGDMRRCLNILQATAMARPSAHIAADDVYACTGQPRPSDVERLCSALLNQPFSAAIATLRGLQTERGLALADLLRALLPLLLRLHMPPAAKVALLESLSEAEAGLAKVTGERFQAAAAVGAFAVARASIVSGVA